MIRFDDVSAVIVTRGDLDTSWTKDLPYGEVIVWDNSERDRDLKVYGRYEAVDRMVTRPVVYFQDDDVRFYEHEALLERYEPGILVANMYDQWIEDCGYYDLALVGLGSIMDTGLWHDAHDRYRRAHPDDDRFLLDPDFIFGSLCRWKRVDFGHEILEVASDPDRLWRQEGQHEGKWRTIRRARALREIVLTIMAKNEAHQIERALESALGLYDKVLLQDTGSTDDTVEVVQAFCEKHGIEFHWESHDFHDFGTNRNLMLERGRELADYQLLMDADEELTGHLGQMTSGWPTLEHDAYVLHYAGELDYGQPRLIFRNFPWQFEGKVHACLGVNGGQTPRGVNLRAPQIVHHGDARHDRARLERDVELLREQIESSQDVPRSCFLLAKAYEGLGNLDLAMSHYQTRVSFGRLNGPDEESYYSRFRLGVLTAEHKNDFPSAARHLLAAWEERPSRVEALRALAYYSTVVADAIPYPEDDMVIVHRDLYRDHSQGE